jgi:hypothetical protein
MWQGKAVLTSWNGQLSKDTHPFGISDETITNILVQTYAQNQPSKVNFKLCNG